ncbi:transcriptional regulator [Micromonospora sp. ATCC 39149]|uniref:MerR family transcriptional regulator n=1 Tax=Micromonospora carbonacea TaxID=47853 RepID=A0A7D6C3U1_9ACTN|nr:MerR family transcriptional regulator [Micromonospora sp. ATCC 39149]EEP70123.1 transcriptional regulator [Micromonospora sp. ATCC 39149]QLJ96564.1 MerR family transcriptional regulator [Micromonospora carbonacea]
MGRSSYRPADLAREHGISTQSVRNYERDGVLPPARRTPSGYRVYTTAHASALRAYLALIPAHGYATSGEIMRAVNAGDMDTALRAIDRSHAQLLRDRETLDAVEVAVGLLTGPPAASRPDRPLAIGGLSRRIGVTSAALRKWERAGVLAPRRSSATGYRLYSADDVRDAELAHLLRRGGYRLDHIATVVRQIRDAAGTEPLAASLDNWRRRLADRGRAMLTAAVRLAEHVSPPDD